MIIIGSDHRGYIIKEELKKYLDEKGIEYKDLGTYSEERADYPVIAQKVAREIQKDENARGILICGTGLGMSIVANKFRGVRCTVCHNEETAKYSRLHNNSNILALGAEGLKVSDAIIMLRTWLATDFEMGRHEERINIINNIEDENFK